MNTRTISIDFPSDIFWLLMKMKQNFKRTLKSPSLFDYIDLRNGQLVKHRNSQDYQDMIL